MLMPERDASDGMHKNMAQHLSGDRTFMWQLSVASGTLCQAVWYTHHPAAAPISELKWWAVFPATPSALTAGTTCPASSWLSAMSEVSFWKNVLGRKEGHRQGGSCQCLKGSRLQACIFVLLPFCAQGKGEHWQMEASPACSVHILWPDKAK